MNSPIKTIIFVYDEGMTYINKHDERSYEIHALPSSVHNVHYVAFGENGRRAPSVALLVYSEFKSFYEIKRDF